MKAMPLTRARHASNFGRALERKGLPVAGLLARSQLPEELLETVSDDSVISALSMLDFAEKAAAATGMNDLGYWAGLLPIENYGEFGARVVRAPTLHAAIRTFCATVLGECSEADYYLVHDAKTAWFCHGPIADGPTQRQHELYALMIMTQVIRLALGTGWRPRQVRLQQPEDPKLVNNEFLRAATIEFKAKITGLAFPFGELAMPLGQSCSQTTGATNSTSPSGASFSPGDPIAALQELIEIQIRQSAQPSIEVVAEAAGMSTRTLQRYLNSRATSYSHLVDQVRFNLAASILKDDSATISEIAYDLGYSNVAHFSRAFSRIAGMSPRVYRGTINK